MSNPPFVIYCRSNVVTYLKTVSSMNSMSVQFHERSVYLGSLMLGNSLSLILLFLSRTLTWQISVGSGSSLVA